VEGVGLAVVAGFPLLGDAGDHLAVFRISRQTLEQLVLDVGFRDAGRFRRVERFRLGAVAAIQNHFGLRCARRYKERRRCQRRQQNVALDQ
jgi:hypothetical protein